MMPIPVICGTIERRILVNFRIDPDVLAQVLPYPFRPQLIHESAMGGICLIRLKNLRPRFMPFSWGIGSENAAHRFAVEWDDLKGQRQTGVYVPRRNTNSRLSTWAGGTIFPGIHDHAHFKVQESMDHLSISLQSDDQQTVLHLSGRVTQQLPESSRFTSLTEASQFFEQGSLGYSATSRVGQYEGLELRCYDWDVEPLEIEHLKSNYFEDSTRFPAGSVEFDCALLMRQIKHEWHSLADLCCYTANRQPKLTAAR